MALTPKHQRFVDEYIVCLNATQAAKLAGYSPKTAASQGERLLRHVEIRKHLEKRRKDLEARVEITQDMVLRELAKIGFSDIRKVVKWGNTEVRVAADDDAEGDDLIPYHGLALIDSSEIDDATAGAIAEVSQGKEGLKVKLYDKKGALVDIGRHLGMFGASARDEQDAELKRLEIEKRRLELKAIKDGSAPVAPVTKIEIEVVSGRPNAKD